MQEKKDLVSKDENTIPTRYFVPNVVLYETDEDLTVVILW